jgi:hypothetical protein
MTRAAVDSGVPARVYEAVSAPFVIDEALLQGAGRCLTVGPGGTVEARGVLLAGTLRIQLPVGARPDTAARWLLVRRGPILDSLGAIVIPTGIVRLTSPVGTQGGGTSPTDAGSNAEVVAQFDAMSCTDVVLPSPATPSTQRGRLVAVADGPAGRVAWVASQSLLPTLQHALIVDLGAASGVKPGDRITVFSNQGGATVATAEIVRVGARTSTALVVQQSLGSLAAGLRIRVTEKLP